MEENDIMERYHRDGIITDEMKDYVYKNARGIYPMPAGVKLLFCRQKDDGNIYRFYEDNEGNLYYDSKWAAEFDRAIRESAKRRREQRYKARYITRKQENG